MVLKEINLALVGLGYVGLPLATEFGYLRNVIGYDIDKKRVDELSLGEDRTLEVSYDQLNSSKGLTFTSELADLSECNFFIITVPTPIDKQNNPDLTPLIKASESIGSILKEGDIVVYESTVYPGATEEVCVPILEQFSGLTFNIDFFIGYSPERINPGDKEHSVTDIIKVTSGSTPEIAETIDQLYRTIIKKGTYKTSSIKVAEAAKVIENTQRDINISLINELAIIFHKLDIDTEEVLLAAGTKWNFLPFRPGLVGGHCIGVDPYYLTHKAQKLGYEPEIILAGRRLNDSMGTYVASYLLGAMTTKSIETKDSNVLILGLAFKENCPDLRNTKVIDIIKELINHGVNVDCYDPCVDQDEAKKEYGISLIEDPKKDYYDAIIIAVAHNEFKKMGISNIRKLGKNNQLIYDLKYLFSAEETDLRL
jgi:UDP-N-acetyl-D-galactosamine dehydrogenase